MQKKTTITQIILYIYTYSGARRIGDDVMLGRGNNPIRTSFPPQCVPRGDHLGRRGRRRASSLTVLLIRDCFRTIVPKRKRNAAIKNQHSQSKTIQSAEFYPERSAGRKSHPPFDCFPLPILMRKYSSTYNKLGLKMGHKQNIQRGDGEYVTDYIQSFERLPAVTTHFPRC